MTDTDATPKNASVSFMLDDESFAALRIQAKTNNRTVSGELRALVHASLQPRAVAQHAPWGPNYLQPYASYAGGTGLGNATYTAKTEGESVG